MNDFMRACGDVGSLVLCVCASASFTLGRDERTMIKMQFMCFAMVENKNIHFHSMHSCNVFRCDG